jgi:hypothetical protein
MYKSKNKKEIFIKSPGLTLDEAIKKAFSKKVYKKKKKTTKK